MPRFLLALRPSLLRYTSGPNLCYHQATAAQPEMNDLAVTILRGREATTLIDHRALLDMEAGNEALAENETRKTANTVTASPVREGLVVVVVMEGKKMRENHYADLDGNHLA